MKIETDTDMAYCTERVIRKNTTLHVRVAVFVLLVSLVLLAPRWPLSAGSRLDPRDLTGIWKSRESVCEGNMWWRLANFSIRRADDDVFVYYDSYLKGDEAENLVSHANPRPREPAARVYAVNDEFYYFEITILQLHGIANKVRFYLYPGGRLGTRSLSGRYIRTVSFPSAQLEIAKEILGSSTVLEGTARMEPDSAGNMRELVDIVVGSCQVQFRKGRWQ
jgi:hypothetical protein